VPFGPADPGSPRPWQWYGQLYQQDCEGLLTDINATGRGSSTRILYGGVAEACLGQWEAAEQDWAALAGVDFTDCLERAAVRLLRDLIAAHRADPGRRITPGPRQKGMACPFKISSISPASGPKEGGTVVTLTGEGFSGVTEVRFGGRAGTDLHRGFRPTNLTVVSPPGTVGTVDVVVVNKVGATAPSEEAKFTYDEPAGGSTGGSGGAEDGVTESTSSSGG
jgi:IPT/TIG domain